MDIQEDEHIVQDLTYGCDTKNLSVFSIGSTVKLKLNERNKNDNNT